MKHSLMVVNLSMRNEGYMFEIDRTDFQILTAFKVVDEETVIILDKPTDGITIAEIMEYLDSVNARKVGKRFICIYKNL